MSMADVFAPVCARQRAEIIHATWGHLDAPVGADLPCTLVFAVSLYDGNQAAVLSVDINLPGGPGFYTDMQDLFERAKGEPGLYRFQGRYKRHKNGNARFYGPITTLKVPHA